MSGSISLGEDFVAGRNLVPSPATGKTAFFICIAPVPALNAVLGMITNRRGHLCNSVLSGKDFFSPCDQTY